MNYEHVFWKKQHYITVKDRKKDFGNRKLLFNIKQLFKILKNQKEQEDIFITKYPKDQLVSCIILDFDSKEDIQLAYNDAKKLQGFTKHHGLNTVIIKSGSKGYHTYTQITPVNFKNNKLWFELFVKELINYESFQYPTLDIGNFKTGLDGNIRVIGSIHPSTNNKCEIIDGKFIEIQLPTDYQYNITGMTNRLYWKLKEEKERKQEELLKKQRKNLNKDFKDPIKENDLRDLMPQIYPSETRTFDKGYLYMQCPFHPDEHPSLLVTKEWYSCSACGEKGNIWTLKKKGHLDFNKEGLIE